MRPMRCANRPNEMPSLPRCAGLIEILTENMGENTHFGRKVPYIRHSERPKGAETAKQAFSFVLTA